MSRSTPRRRRSTDSGLSHLASVALPALSFVVASASFAGCGKPYLYGEEEDGGFHGTVVPADRDSGFYGAGKVPTKAPQTPRTPRGGNGYFDDAGTWIPGADGGCFEAHQKPDRISVQVTSTKVVPKPVAIFLMQDRSSSMVGLCDFGQLCNPFAWTETTGAVRAFANDPKSAGLDVGLGFFPPLNATGATQGACDGSSCAVPAVPIGRLPATAPALEAALLTGVPSSNSLAPNYTPTECGMRGMVDYCKAYTKQTGVQCVAVLITDGAPTRCSADAQVLTKIALDGKALGVKTFTIGMFGANFILLDALANAGGTDCDPQSASFACDVSQGDTLLAALNAIRESVKVTETRTEVQTKQLDCEWKIPPPPAGEVFDPAKVNFQFTGQSGAVKRVGFVPSAAACKSTGDLGWYFDDPAKPAKISVCPASCAEIKAAKDASVDITFGCAREDAPVVVVR